MACSLTFLTSLLRSHLTMELFLTTFHKVGLAPALAPGPLSPALLCFVVVVAFSGAYYTCWLFHIEWELPEGQDFDPFTPLLPAAELADLVVCSFQFSDGEAGR